MTDFNQFKRPELIFIIHQYNKDIASQVDKIKNYNHSKKYVLVKACESIEGMVKSIFEEFHTLNLKCLGNTEGSVEATTAIREGSEFYINDLIQQIGMKEGIAVLKKQIAKMKGC